MQRDTNPEVIQRMPRNKDGGLGGGTGHSLLFLGANQMQPLATLCKSEALPHAADKLTCSPWPHFPFVPSSSCAGTCTGALSLLSLFSDVTPQKDGWVKHVLSALFTPGMRQAPQRLGNE